MTLFRDHDALVSILEVQRWKKRYAKCWMVVTIEFVKLDPDTYEVTDSVVIYLRSGNFVLTKGQDYSELVHRAMA